MNYDEKIKFYVRQIVRNYQPEKIILFGSFAWGEPRAESDIDLFIIKNTKTKRLYRRGEALENIDYDISIDLIILTPSEIHYLKNQDAPFIKKILKDGLVLYEKN